jgi:hypothetical protein
MTPFEVVYGQNPPLVLSYMSRVSKVQEFNTNLRVHEAILHALKSNFFMDQNHMKKKEYQGCFE